MKQEAQFKYIILISIIFHILYLKSVFDIHFRSPILLSPEAESKIVETKAKRLILISIDGLKASTLFKYIKETPGSFIKRKAGKGQVGISHTRVPTESRPGHVAMIAGMYEDVSAITKGWKINPVDFDSVFNRSATTFAFGSPDIVRIFEPKKHDSRGAEYVPFYYGQELENFSLDPRLQDNWVFDKVLDFFSNPKNHLVLNKDGIIIFLHLLGVDTAGHAYNPSSIEYVSTLDNVDKKLVIIYNLIKSYYTDNQTSWIITSDHGMGSQGSHGDGNPDNTRVPWLAWGNGIKSPIKVDGEYRIHHLHNNNNEEEMKLNKDWKLNNVIRTDIDQADLAPLIGKLILSIQWVFYLIEY